MSFLPSFNVELQPEEERDLYCFTGEEVANLAEDLASVIGEGSLYPLVKLLGMSPPPSRTS
jgi:hypothetical protein